MRSTKRRPRGRAFLLSLTLILASCANGMSLRATKATASAIDPTLVACATFGPMRFTFLELQMLTAESALQVKTHNAAWKSLCDKAGQ